ncbi:MAG: U32 family peptidase [Chitinophagaceae bacterium]|jgi:putative protease|nr:U32 family peptidase [Chitinophagaceae bacterium]MBP6046092.1 U32 family peptidase [Ferruginibacter sp.]MBK7345554.1 U32 family peptidase [Chitinophagaceae bacterium]MBK7734956.1 U32 family peptidase [Chitinophagaceae bacterium]MBK8930084.1 U32 family peptidase [Chitinophagaceae bacterium]
MKSKNIKKKIELLAPVGSFESLHAAIQAGADAIYFGVAQLNMRAKSINSFFLSDLPLIQATCSQHHIKTYITLNTVMYEHDMQLLKTILKEVKKHKIDAVIASDFAVMEYCRQLHIPLHVSTQANVSNIESIKFFASFSDAVVLARELTLKQVKQITAEIARKKINGISGKLMRIEIFIHGALCMAVSGKCYLSLHAQNSSANRGACSQNCRHAYKVTDIDTQEELVIENNYIMSPKDLCTIDILDQVIESGATILKIEGRGKGPEYVSIVTKIYKKALLAIEENSYTKEKIDLWKNELAKVYNRGFWEGYYLGRKLGEWTDNPGSAATEKKIYVGKGKKYFSKIKVGEFLIETGSIKVGDTLLLTGPGFGLIKQPVEKLLVNGAISSEAVKGDFVTLACEHKISPTDKLYKIIKT